MEIIKTDDGWRLQYKPEFQDKLNSIPRYAIDDLNSPAFLNCDEQTLTNKDLESKSRK